MSDKRDISTSSGSRALVDEYASLIKRYVLLQSGARAAARTKTGSSIMIATRPMRSSLAIFASRGKGGAPLPAIRPSALRFDRGGQSRPRPRRLAFEPGRGARFSTYALWWIKAAIHDYILRSRSLVKMGTTAAQRKLFFGLRRAMKKFGSDRTGLTPEVAEAVAHELVAPRPRRDRDEQPPDGGPLPECACRRRRACQSGKPCWSIIRRTPRRSLSSRTRVHRKRRHSARRSMC